MISGNHTKQQKGKENPSKLGGVEFIAIKALGGKYEGPVTLCKSSACPNTCFFMNFLDKMV